MSKTNTINYSRILVFILLAFTLSNIFRFDVFGTRAFLQQLPDWLYLLCMIFLEGFGVLVGAIVGLYWLHTQRSTAISVWGSSAKYSIMMGIVPLVLMSAIGVANDYALQPNLYGLLVGFGSLLYCLMEEMGWRYYLEEELKNVSSIKRYLIIGCIWYLWHLSFLTEANLFENVFFLLMLILGSWGIGQVVTATQSVLACACFHLIIQIMLFNSLIKNGLTGNEKLLIMVVCVVAWIIILKKWKEVSAATTNPNDVI